MPRGGCIGTGSPVEIISRRIDLTRGQFWIVAVAMFTALGTIAATAQGWVAYHDWGCKNEQRSFFSCPALKPLAPSAQSAD